MVQIVMVVPADLALLTSMVDAAQAVKNSHDNTSVFRGCDGFES
jgi:hypothetical protein